MEKICYGCGAILQNTDEHLIGYTPKLTDEPVLCKRCFRLRNYHELKEANINDHDFISILDSIDDERCLVIYVIDLFNLNGSIINGLSRHIGNNPILIVGNKRDLLPKSLKDSRIIRYLQHFLKTYNINPIDIVLISSKKKHAIDDVYNIIDHYNNYKNVYVIGNTNAGKSTFINSLLDSYTRNNDSITVSEVPGTTLGIIRHQLDENTCICDTPGIMNQKSYLSHIPLDYIQHYQLNTEVKPVTFQLKAQQSLYISGFGRIDFIKGEPTSFICFFSKNIQLHRTKLVNADKIYNNSNVLDFKFDSIHSINQMRTDELSLNSGKYDIDFVGLGFVSIVGNNTQLRVYHPDFTDIYIRKSFI